MNMTTLLPMKTVVFFILLTISMVTSGQYINYPKNDFGTGPSIAFNICDHKIGYSVNYDNSYTYGIFTSSINLKYLNINGNENVGFQSEFTLWFLANIGGGIGYLFGNKPAPIYHGFIGIPYGDDNFKHGPFHSIYVEPYYRINNFNKKTIHEFGIMVKITTYTI
jgi:hypothetical protein